MSRTWETVDVDGTYLLLNNRWVHVPLYRTNLSCVYSVYTGPTQGVPAVQPHRAHEASGPNPNMWSPTIFSPIDPNKNKGNNYRFSCLGAFASTRSSSSYRRRRTAASPSCTAHLTREWRSDRHRIHQIDGRSSPAIWLDVLVSSCLLASHQVQVKS
jgi:hypothetical protein